MMSEALQIATLIATLPLVLCFTGILVYTSRKTGRAILIGALCLPVVAAVLYLVVYVAELVVSSSVIAAQGRTLKHCHSREGASVYNQFNAHANPCQPRVQRRALRKSLMKLRKKGQKAERQAENTHRKCRIAFRLLQILRLPCYTPLMESMLRTCLWCVLLHGFAQGDVAATGACILWMLGLHGNTAAACRAFSMLVMLGLDARSFPPEGKVLLCAAVAVAPLFPPPKKTPADYMRETRDFRALHKCDPVENPGTPGYALAMRIRKARAKGIFNAAELAELDSKIPAPAAKQNERAGAVAAVAKVAQPRSAPTKTSPTGSAFSPALGGASLGSGIRSGSDIARPSDPLIVEAAEPQAPDPEIDGGELVLDDPPPSWRSVIDDITGHRPGNTSSATGQEVEGNTTSSTGLAATLNLPGLNINWPFSQLILAGVKTVEVRSYALGYRNIAQPAVEMWLVETPGIANAISKGGVLVGGVAVAPRPKDAQIVGAVTFSHSVEYETPAAFRADSENHRIAKGGSYDWDGKAERHAWRVSAVRRFARPVPQPGRKGITGFTEKRPHTVSFDETAGTVGPRRGESASAAVPSRREGHRATTGKRDAPASHESAASAAAPKTRKRSEIPDVPLREGLFFDPQQGAWCGMHALNNYCLNGRLVQQQDCRDAACLVAGRLTDACAGDVEPISNHLDPITGWLSIDVINVLGQANLGLHVEGGRVSWPDGLRRQQDGAALVNWNQQHWTVLQRDPSGDGWMHTNSIEGVGPRYGRRRRLSEEAVQEVLEDIRRYAGGLALHAITRAVGTEGRQYLEREGWRSLAPAESEEESGDAAARAEAKSDALSLVTLNVDGLGDYTDSPAARMDAILTHVLVVEPDVLVLQEMTAPMLTQLRHHLPDWKVCRRSAVSEYYFNVTVMRLVKILACYNPCLIKIIKMFSDYDVHEVFHTTKLSTNSSGGFCGVFGMIIFTQFSTQLYERKMG